MTEDKSSIDDLFREEDIPFEEGAEEDADTLADRVVDYLNVSRNSAPDAS